MNYSHDSLIEMYEKYKSKKGLKPFFISDWDVVSSDAAYPYNSIRNALDIPEDKCLLYSFADEQTEIKRNLSELLNTNNVTLDEGNICVTISSTASIYLSIIELIKRGVSKYLVITPAYYSVIETITDRKGKVWDYPLFDHDGFSIDVNELSKVIDENKIEALIFTDPVYSAGCEISIEEIDVIRNICVERKMWLICDASLSGLEWSHASRTHFNYKKLSLISSCENFIYIESITKRMLVNGLKHSLVLSSNSLIKSIEDLSSKVYGGFCIPQIELLKELYSSKNMPYVTSILEHNTTVLKNNFNTIRAAIMGSNYSLYNANSGYFTMLMHKNYKIKEVNEMKVVSNFLWGNNVFVLPSSHFSYHHNNKFAYRINLMKDMSAFIPFLEKCIWEDIYLLD